MLPRTIRFGTFIHNTSLRDLAVIGDGMVGVDGHGVIRFVEQGKGVRDYAALGNMDGLGETAREWIRGAGDGEAVQISRASQDAVTFWYPGFVDTHIHASQIPNAGVFGKSTLLDWLQTFTFPVESSFSSLSAAERMYTRCIRDTLAHGTTTAAYYATIHVPATNLLATKCLEMGQRAFIGRVCMNSDLSPEHYRDASPASAIEDTKATISHIRSIDPEHRLVTPIITPRFAPSCTPALLAELGALQRETNLPVQTHIAENPSELALVHALFPEHASYAAVYDAHGLLTPRTVLAHACHLAASEVALIQARGAKISHCPVSNSYLGSGICPVRELLDAGVDLGLGTDVSGGYSPSMLVAAREAGGVSRIRAAAAPGLADDARKEQMKLSVEETLYLATRGGAKCLGLEDKVGGFEVGKYFDAQLVDLGELVSPDGERGGSGNVKLWGREGWEERIAKWVFCGDDRNTRAVYVAGRLVSGGRAAAE